MRLKKLAFSTLFIILILTGCARQEAEPLPPTASTTRTPPPPTAALTQVPSETPHETTTITPTTGPTLTPTKVFNNNVEKGDYLIYHLFHDKKLFFYDPATDIHIPILPDWEINTFAVSLNDQIAFSSTIGEQSDIYILDYPYWENSPINITSTPEISEYPESWSPDGNYLILGATSEENRILAVWDGTNFNQIHEFTENSQMGFSSGAWSPDGKYAFEVHPDYKENDLGTEIFVWSGNPEVVAVNVSQNPSFDDLGPTWSLHGDLAFLSRDKIGEDIFKHYRLGGYFDL